MTDSIWARQHTNYKDTDWINAPSLFAQAAIHYFPKSGKILDLGAGQGQDSRYFAEAGYQVVSTDLEDTALELSKQKTPAALQDKLTFQKLDLRQAFPSEPASFDIVYAHLSLHYFDYATTQKIFVGIERALKPGGTLAFLVNSTNDPEYNTGQQIEPDFFQIDQTTKRYFSLETAGDFAKNFVPILLDDNGETYKDRAKGVSNLVRFVGCKPL